MFGHHTHTRTHTNVHSQMYTHTHTHTHTHTVTGVNQILSGDGTSQGPLGVIPGMCYVARRKHVRGRVGAVSQPSPEADSDNNIFVCVCVCVWVFACAQVCESVCHGCLVKRQSPDLLSEWVCTCVCLCAWKWLRTGAMYRRSLLNTHIYLSIYFFCDFAAAFVKDNWKVWVE